ncbi:hypothetical protein GQ53DRAFT_811972 [Thozetella sp. PMI_491]|nr:hypothetical protein GQ53DRAFT_811972 [Thozetella sp. PMI_491]
MSDFRVSTVKRYRDCQRKDDKYTLQCPVDISRLSPEARVPVRQRGGASDNFVFYIRAGDLEPDESRDRRHNMDAQGKLKRTYSEGLQDGTLVWIEGAYVAENGTHIARVVSLADFSRAEVEVSDLLCRPDRVSRDDGNIVVTLVGPTYADGTNRRGNELIRQVVIEQELDGPGTRVRAMKKSDLDDKYTHAKKDRCIDLLNMREAALRDAASRRPRTSSWLATVTDMHPSEETRGYAGNNPFVPYWCVRPSKLSRPARPNPFSSPSPSLPGFKARPVPRLRLANLSVPSRSPSSPLVSPATAAAPAAAPGGARFAELPVTPSTSAGGPSFAAYYADGARAAMSNCEDIISSGFQAARDLWAAPLGSGPSPFWGDEEMDEERCPKCGSVLKPDGSCEADWCK